MGDEQRIVQGTSVRLSLPILALAALLSLTPASLRSQGPEAETTPTGPPDLSPSVSTRPPATGAVRLTLMEATVMGLTNNSALAVRNLDPAIATTRADRERGAFDYLVTLDSQAQGVELPTGNQLLGARISDVETQFANVGVQRKLRSGAIVSSRFENQRLLTNSSFQLINPQYTSAMVLSVVQPLSRGAGRSVNTADLRINLNGIEQGRQRLRKVMLDLAAEVERQYWELSFALKDRDVKVNARQTAQALAAHNRLRVTNAAGTESEVVEALGAVAARAADVAVAERQISDSTEILRRLVGLSSQTSDPELHPTSPLPTLPSRQPVARALATAFEKRPDYRDALIELTNRDIRVAFLKNQVRPRLDLIASYAQNGLSSSYGDALGQIAEGDFQSYALGVQVEFPIENRTARAEHREGQLQKQQALLAVRALEDRIEEEVRRAVRAVETDRVRVEAARLAEELAIRQFGYAVQRFQEGLIVNIDLVRFQQELAGARTRSLRAVHDLLKSGVDLEAATGTLLDARGFKVERPVATAAAAGKPAP